MTILEKLYEIKQDIQSDRYDKDEFENVLLLLDTGISLYSDYDEMNAEIEASYADFE